MKRKKIILSEMEAGETFSLPGPMPSPCKDCPFVSKTMQMSLGKERLDGIKSHVEGGGFFPCHKTIDYDKQSIAQENGQDYDLDDVLNRRECAGAVAHREATK